jgi:cytochrome d ubiquinol oxidase subunit I
LWILIANSFMQQPVGYVINEAAGRAEMVDFFEVILNPNIWVQFPHTVMAGLVTAAFFVLGISVYHLAKGNEKDMFNRSFQIGAILGTIAIVMVVLSGHSQAQHMVESQPMKMAAAEALWYSEDPASFSLITIGDLQQRNDVFAIRLPHLLSLLAYNQLDGEVKGIYNLQEEFETTYGPGNYIPPIAITYWSFRIMVGAGFALLVMGVYALFQVMGEEIKFNKWMTRIFIWGIALPYLANSFGWIMTEVGRLPWAVYGLLKVNESISPNVGPGALLFTLIGFTLVYGILMVVDVRLLTKYAKIMPAKEDAVAS